MPSFRNRMWDGKIRLFSQKYKEIYFGLFPYIKAFAEERGYNIVCGENVDVDNKVDKDIVLGIEEFDINLLIPHEKVVLDKKEILKKIINNR